MNGGMTMRSAAMAMLAFLAFVTASPVAFAGDLRIAAWNLEHLDDTDGAGCVGRTGADYAELGRWVEDLDADVVAFQEVENAAAARRVFPEPEWRVELSGRPPPSRSRPCWNRSGARLGHLATGFAIRRSVAYERNADLEELDAGHGFQRWGTDITVMAGGQQLRLLSVHLKTGCWGTNEDRQNGKRKICTTLRGQVERLRAWANARRAEGTAFAILGDFNRRLALRRDWAWAMLSPPSAPLRLLTRGMTSGCDARYPAFIDHIIAGGGAEAMMLKGSFREASRRGPHPDHCAISAVFRLAN